MAVSVFFGPQNLFSGGGEGWVWNITKYAIENLYQSNMVKSTD